MIQKCLTSFIYIFCELYLSFSSRDARSVGRPATLFQAERPPQLLDGLQWDYIFTDIQGPKGLKPADSHDQPNQPSVPEH